jgi:hypothetical protein
MEENRREDKERKGPYSLRPRFFDSLILPYVEVFNQLN